MSMRVWGSVRGLLVVIAFLFSALSAPDDGFTRTHRSVSTRSATAQDAFDDGLTLLYAFNPEEARVSFKRALAADPTFALGWWGVAMSHGTNINTSFDPGEQRLGREAIAKARTLASAATPAERALIDAATRRFAFDRTRDADASARAYRDAMSVAASDAPDDDDIVTLAAEAEMDVHPWAYFNRDGSATSGTDGAIARLRSVLARDPAHIGANHLLIHALEESPHPGDALDAARALAGDRFEPAAEHLIHMPAHDFMRVGLYHDAGVANARALEAYRSYLAGEHAGHTDYYGHDCVFGVDAFMMSGEYQRARTLALGCNHGAGGLVAAVDMRFARYDALASDPNPGPLAHGLLALRDGSDARAATDLATLRKETDDTGTISAALLEAAIARHHANAESEIAALERGVAVQDREGYSEPPRFWMPLREALGTAYDRAGRFADAERTFRAGLTSDPDDPRALDGLARALAHESRDVEARAVERRFADAWRQADVAIAPNDL